MVRQTYYGRLDLILECHIPDDPFWPVELKGNIRLLAIITPCETEGEDATKELLMYKKMTTQIATDLQCVECVVGRAETRKNWGIIDRSGDFARTEFISSSSIQGVNDFED